jgi:DNA-binding FadR family transcriptional regulator
MDITPVTRAAVSDAVFGRLVDEILSGRLGPEEPLPSERDLAESFGVNRHAVREALKRLQQAGLVRIAQGGKTRAQDWRQHAGLDTLSGLASSGALPPLRLLHDITEMRRSVAADAARLCAVRASDTQLAAVTEAAARYPTSPRELSDVFAADLAFWTAIIEGSGNVAYRLGLNTLVAGFDDIGWQTIADLGLSAEYVDSAAHVELARLISARDGAGAHQLAGELLGRIVGLLAVALEE